MKTRLLTGWLLIQLVSLLLLLTPFGLWGCRSMTGPDDVPTPQTEVERLLISETARFAGMLSVRVHGELSDRDWPDGRVGWYEGGVAYYNRAMVAKWVTVVPTPGHETATNVAAHEVAHAVTGPNHDCLHWTLCAQIAQATYPSPCK